MKSTAWGRHSCLNVWLQLSTKKTRQKGWTKYLRCLRAISLHTTVEQGLKNEWSLLITFSVTNLRIRLQKRGVLLIFCEDVNWRCILFIVHSNEIALFSVTLPHTSAATSFDSDETSSSEWQSYHLPVFDMLKTATHPTKTKTFHLPKRPCNVHAVCLHQINSSYPSGLPK